MRIFLAVFFILAAPGFLRAQGSLGDMARQNRGAVNIAGGTVGMMTVGTTGSTAFRSTGTTAVSISVGTSADVSLNFQAEFGGGSTVFGTGGRFNNFRITDVATPLSATGIAGFRKAGTEGFTLEPFANDGGIYLGVDKPSFLGFGDGSGGVHGLLRATGASAFSLRGANDVTLADLTLGALNATGTGTISQLTLANGTAASATFQLSSTGTLTIDPSGATHRVYIPGEFYTDFLQMTGYATDTVNMRIDNVTLDTGNGAEFTAPALTTGNIILASATGTGSGTASALRLVNTRTGSGTNVGLTINATGTGAKAIDIESVAINLGSGVTIGNGTAAFTVPIANGTNGQVLTFAGAGGTSWTTVSGGSGGGLTMGGTSGQVLYNNAGAIGSVPGLTVTGTAVTATGMTLASGTTTLAGVLSGGTTNSVRVRATGVVEVPFYAGGLVFGTGSVLGGAGSSMFSVNGQFVRCYANGVETLGWGNDGARLSFSKALIWSTSTSDSSSGIDTAISRGTTGIIHIGTNATNALGGFIAATGTIGSMTAGTGRLSTPNVELSHATLASGTSASVDFGGAAFQSVTATGTSLVLTGTGYPATGSTARSVTLFITAGTAALTVTPGSGWRYVGTGTAAANKMLFVGMTATGSAGSNVRAAFSAEQ